MRKFLLLSAIAIVVQFVNAQAPLAPPTRLYNAWIEQSMRREQSPVLLQSGANPARSNAVRNAAANAAAHVINNAKALLDGTPLNSQKIGSAGNLLTITQFSCNQLYVNNALNLVSFIHRVDNSVIPSGNIAQFAYDYSTTGGQTWTNNVGPITVGPIANGDNIDNLGTDPHGRFPQAAIYNPNGNTDLANAQLVYSGTYHNSPPTGTTTGSWLGQMYGRGPVTGPASSYNVHVDTLNGGVVDIASGFCQSVPGTFWAVNEDWTGTFSTTGNDITRGILVEKGVWNSGTGDVDWTTTEIYQQFDSQTVSGSIISAAQSFDIAFDPTGQYGWISCLGDITTGPTDSVNQPIFWNTTDGGITWNGPTQLNLDSLPGVDAGLNTKAYYGNGATTSGIATTSFEAKLAVDYNGNPHLLCTVGNGGGYSIEQGAGYYMYDITRYPNNACVQTTDSGWAAVFIDSVQTLRGNTTADATPLTEDNRPLVSRSADGTKMFFFWSASDYAVTGGDDNKSPNLFVRGFDLVHSLSTPTINLTEGDPNWGGPVSTGSSADQNGGTFGGAWYSTVSPIAQTTSTGFTIPLVLTQIDYQLNTDMSGNPAQFWYIDNLNFSPFDFTVGNTASITINGPDTIYLHIDSPYVDQGATVSLLDTSCTHSGNLHSVTNTSALHDSIPGTYLVNYSAEDSNGNVYANANRVVIVVSAPRASFGYSDQPLLNVQFTDNSLYNPTFWAWNFGDTTTDIGPDQNPTHVYTHAGTFYVCLYDTNQYGRSNTYCDSVVVSGTIGIKQIDFSSNINLFPNPANGNVAITISGNQLPDFTVSVYNVLGEEVMPVSEYKAGTTNLQLNAADLADGIYLVKIQSTTGSAVKRLAVSHK